MKYVALPEMFTGMGLYGVHFVLRETSKAYNGTILRGYFSDVLALIVCVPIFINIQILFGTRRVYRIHLWEIGLYLLIFSFVYEYLYPMIWDKSTADLYDVVAYALGGIILWAFQILRDFRRRSISK
jgi:hypothetical protein